MRAWWAIWDFDANDWVRELPSSVDDGGEAILVFASKQAACRRAAKHYGFDSYAEAKRKGWCEVAKIGVTCRRVPRRSKVVRKRGA